MAKRRAPGLVNFVAVLAYHFGLALPVVITQPGARILAVPCRLSDDVVNHWMDGSTLRRKKAIVSTTEESEQASTDDGGPLRTGL